MKIFAEGGTLKLFPTKLRKNHKNFYQLFGLIFHETIIQDFEEKINFVLSFE